MLLLNKKVDLDSIPYHGRFGAKRKHDIHTGLDLYCEEGTEVFSIENGKILDICWFTGTEAESPWWNNTHAIIIGSGMNIILYGEIETDLEKGNFVKKGQLIGKVKKVLKVDKNLPMDMLHIELYDRKYKGRGEWWKLGDEKPKYLKNVEELFLLKFIMITYIVSIITTDSQRHIFVYGNKPTTKEIKNMFFLKNPIYDVKDWGTKISSTISFHKSK